jgi:hypothetical protein
LTVSGEELVLPVFLLLALGVLLPAVGAVVAALELVAGVLDDPQPAMSSNKAQASSAGSDLAIEFVRLA